MNLLLNFCSNKVFNPLKNQFMKTLHLFEMEFIIVCYEYSVEC